MSRIIEAVAYAVAFLALLALAVAQWAASGWVL